jgi:Mrp family chromosome partitioning ATPase
MLDQRIRSTIDLSAIPGSRILGVIPDLKDDPTDASRAETVVRDHTSSVVAESYRQFATAFRKARGEAGARTVLFSSGMPDAGTTSVVLNLAATAVAAGRSVAIVDANFRRPRIGSILGFDSEAPGFGDVLCDAATIDDVIQTTSDGISVIPAGTAANRVIERFDGESAGRFLKDIGSRFDVLLIDGPPLVVASESMSIAHAVDATVLVVRAFSEHRGLVARLIRQLNEHSGVLLGVVLNRPRNTAGGYFRRNYEAIAAYSNDQDPD